MSFYSDMAEVAVELLNEFGQSITLTRTTGGSINPVTGVVVPGADDSKQTFGVIMPIKRPFADGFINQTLISESNRQAILSPDVEPLITDRINGMEIVNIDEISPAGTVLAYRLLVKS